MLARLAAVLLPLTLAALVLAPLWIDQPFGTQTAGSLAAVYDLRRWAPVLSVIGAVAMTTLAVAKWRPWRRPLARIALALAWVMALAAAWVARQSPFEWMYNPLPRPEFAAARSAAFVEPQDLVLAVSVNGDSVAYPIRLMAYHHVVNDVVGGVPLAATY